MIRIHTVRVYCMRLFCPVGKRTGIRSSSAAEEVWTNMSCAVDDSVSHPFSGSF